MGMLSLALVLSVRAATGSYEVAGIAAAAYSLGAGAGSPMLGRLADRLGRRPVLVVTGIVDALLLIVLAAGVRQPLDSAPTVALATAAGVLNPPLTACIRAAWPKLVSTVEDADRAYAFDAVLIELVYLLGPLIVAATVVIASPAAALVLAALLGAVGSLVFAAFPAASPASVPPGDGLLEVSVTRHPSALQDPGMRVVVVALLVWSLTFGVLDVAVPAFAVRRGGPEYAGLLLAGFTFGGISGGLWYGARSWRRTAVDRLVLALVAYALGLVPLLVVHSIPAMLGFIAVGGLSLAPVASPAYRLVSELAPPGTLTEAYAWIELALAMGLGIGAAVTGWLVEAAGDRWALAAALAGPLLAMVVVLLGLPYLRPRTGLPEVRTR